MSMSEPKSPQLQEQFAGHAALLTFEMRKDAMTMPWRVGAAHCR
jgi:hypothetical protein